MLDRSPADLWLGKKYFAVFLVYLALLCFAVHFYRPWEDEGRAWLIARNNSLFQLLTSALGYEGHPSLWYLILWLPAHLGMPYRFINGISAAIAAAGVYVLLRYSPFPFYVRALLPFGFALFYQYGVVARSYVLIPLLAFTAAQLYRAKAAKPVSMAVILGLLANVVLYTAAVAIALGGCYALKLARRRKQVDPPLDPGRLWIAFAVFAASLVLFAGTSWPPLKIRQKISHALFYGSTARVIQIAPTTGMEPIAGPPKPSVRSGPAPGSGPPRSQGAFIVTTFVLAYPVAANRWLAIAFELLVSCYLWRRGVPELILPLATLACLFLFGYYRLWHLQMLWVFMLAILWAAWDEFPELANRQLQTLVAVSLGLLCVLQLPWTLAALQYEGRHATYPAEAAASYLRAVSGTQRIGGSGLASTVLPYLAQDIFVSDAEGNVPNLVSMKPDLIVADNTLEKRDIDLLAGAGYRETHSFCGAPYFPNWTVDPICLTIYETPR